MGGRDTYHNVEVADSRAQLRCEGGEVASDEHAVTILWVAVLDDVCLRNA